VPARRAGGRGAAAGPDRERRAVPRAHAGRARRGDARAGDGPPHLGHGPGHHDQLGDAVNKGLEVVEAHLLFGTPYDALDVVVHPQSVVHSMVEFVDGSTLAQASPPDMRLPIGLALGWPDRLPRPAYGLDWTTAASWDFEPLDADAFPAVELCKQAGRRGRHGARRAQRRERGVRAGLRRGRLPFLGIVDTVAAVVAEHPLGERATLADVLTSEEWARTRASELVARSGGSRRGRDA
jgi:1-deoxy-D-xylulose-5-phosphate reductoisomerase